MKQVKKFLKQLFCRHPRSYGIGCVVDTRKDGALYMSHEFYCTHCKKRYLGRQEDEGI